MNRGLDLRIGARGWNHPAWVDQYYPNDLPEEWRLAYYANEFRSVSIPSNEWLFSDQEKIVQWSNDIHEDFRFILEWPLESLINSQNNKAELEKIIEPIFSRISGLLILVTNENNSILVKDFTNLPQWCNKYPVHIEFNNSVPDYLRQEMINKFHAQPCWSTGELKRHNLHQDLALGLIQSSPALSLKELRQQIESFILYAAGCREAVLLFSGKPPSIDSMQNAKIISELLIPS